MNASRNSAFPSLLAFAISGFASVALGQAQPSTELEIHHSRETGRATFVTARGGGPIRIDLADGTVSAAVSPDQFLQRHGRLFGIADPTRQLTLQKADADLLGHNHTTYRQVHRGVPVFGGQVKVHQDELGQVYAANGPFFPVPEKMPVQPSRTVADAVGQAAAILESAHPKVIRSELTVVDPGWYGDAPTGARLAYYIELEVAESKLAHAFFVDAITGKLLDDWSLVESARNRRIHDGQQTSDLPGFLTRAEGQAPIAGGGDVNRAYDYYGDTYDYFARGFGRDSMDDEGMAMLATVNSTAPGCPNAFWSSARRQMAFCTGTVTDDVTAHELTHGITFFTAGLIYQNQSGQLNESFSDVFGELVDLFNGNAAFALPDGGVNWPVHPTGPGLDQLNSLRTECSPRVEYFDGVRWLIGEDAYAFGGSIRDMWDPTCHGDPDRAMSPLQTCGPGDNGGVHSGSGIPNHAFAILVDSKTFNGFTVRGIGPIKAGAVWYRALTTYLTPTSDFEDAYVAFNQAARDLLGTRPLDPRSGLLYTVPITADDVVQVDLALRAVEMNGPGRCGWTVPMLALGSPPQCGDERLVYFDSFESGASGWSVENSAPLTPYNWIVQTNLPYGRVGRAWFCNNPSLGDCVENDESGVHWLVSPAIELPAAVEIPLLRFTHYMDVETSWDGGLVSVRVNGGRWRQVLASDFHFNPYNTKLQTQQRGNTNPLRGNEAWSGIGGGWGTSVVNLSRFAGGGDTIEIRFEFGKDGCTGRIGWFVDDVAVYGCSDCNQNGYGDDLDLNFSVTSGPLANIGVNSPQRFNLHNAPPAGGDVVLRFHAIADLFGEVQDESINVFLNDAFLAEIFDGGARDCPTTPDRAELTISAEQFNEARREGQIVIDMVATPSVDPLLCGRQSWIRVDIEYQTSTKDENEDLIPDECQNCAPPPTATIGPSGPMNRYLEVTVAPNEYPVAYRLRRIMSGGASNLDVRTMWLGPPSSGPASATARPTYSKLQCDPWFGSEWNAGKPLLITGEFIQPGANYVIESVQIGCWVSMIADQPRSSRVIPHYFSKPLALATTRIWGDVVGMEGSAAPDGSVNFQDVAAVVERFRNVPGAVDPHRADLAPAVPDGVVDFTDIAQALNAYRGQDYPYSDQSTCPR